jgi:hypothetical protein
VRTDTQHVTGALIGGTFGGVFVLADANTPLGDVAEPSSGSGLLAAYSACISGLRVPDDIMRGDQRAHGRIRKT